MSLFISHVRILRSGSYANDCGCLFSVSLPRGARDWSEVSFVEVTFPNHTHSFLNIISIALLCHGLVCDFVCGSGISLSYSLVS